MSTPWIYLAGPLFTQAEVAFNQQLAERLRAAGYRVFLPQQECAGLSDPEALYQNCLRGVQGAALVLAVLDGTDADSGTCFEVGYAVALGKPAIGLRTDFRGTGEYRGLNLMLGRACQQLILVTSEPTPTASAGVHYLKMGEDCVPALLKVLSHLDAAMATRRPDS